MEDGAVHTGQTVVVGMFGEGSTGRGGPNLPVDGDQLPEVLGRDGDRQLVDSHRGVERPAERHVQSDRSKAGVELDTDRCHEGRHVGEPDRGDPALGERGLSG